MSNVKIKITIADTAREYVLSDDLSEKIADGHICRVDFANPEHAEMMVARVITQDQFNEEE